MSDSKTLDTPLSKPLLMFNNTSIEKVGGPQACSHVLHHITSCSVKGPVPCPRYDELYFSAYKYWCFCFFIWVSVQVTLRREACVSAQPAAACLNCFLCRASWMIHEERDVRGPQSSPFSLSLSLSRCVCVFYVIATEENEMRNTVKL